MEIKPIGYYHGPIDSKFGLPRQSGIVESLEGRIELEKEYRREEALRGLEGFDHIWLIWGFSANPQRDNSSLTVRPPRLGGNRSMGVFATRSPFRPNPLGLSAVILSGIEQGTDGLYIRIKGADLMDGTPIYDIKPYIKYADSYPDATGGFVDENEWKELKVEMSEKALDGLSSSQAESLRGILAQDPRPQYQDDPEKIYGISFEGKNHHFSVKDGILYLLD